MLKRAFPGIVFGFALLVSVSTVCAREYTVAQDGSGDFSTVQAAVAAVPTGTPEKPVFIRVKAGDYNELVYIQREKRFLNIVGEDPVQTRIHYGLYAGMIGLDGLPIGTFRTPTVTVDADDVFIANLTIENTAGPVGQALAIRVDGDRIVFKNCRFLGWQDTVFLNRGRQYFENCRIVGSTDFVFGGATAYFREVELHCLRSSYITAASTPAEAKYGFVFDQCTITAESDDIRVFLGRPWRDYSSVAFIHTEMPANIRPEGWHNWNRPEREATVRYYEYNNSGPGAELSERVSWMQALSKDSAETLTPERVLGGVDQWNPLQSRPSCFSN